MPQIWKMAENQVVVFSIFFHQTFGEDFLFPGFNSLR